MSMREVDRLQIIQAVVDGSVKPERAAVRLGMSERPIFTVCIRREK